MLQIRPQPRAPSHDKLSFEACNRSRLLDEREDCIRTYVYADKLAMVHTGVELTPILCHNCA